MTKSEAAMTNLLENVPANVAEMTQSETATTHLQEIAADNTEIERTAGFKTMTEPADTTYSIKCSRRPRPAWLLRGRAPEDAQRLHAVRG